MTLHDTPLHPSVEAHVMKLPPLLQYVQWAQWSALVQLNPSLQLAPAALQVPEQVPEEHLSLSVHTLLSLHGEPDGL